MKKNNQDKPVTEKELSIRLDKHEERLAIMIRKGFDGVYKRFDQVDLRMDRLETRMERVELRLVNVVYRPEFEGLNERVKFLEGLLAVKK